MARMSDAATLLQRWWNELWGAGNLDVLGELLAPLYTRHDQNGTRTFTVEQYRDEIDRYTDLMEGARTTIDDMAVAGDRVWARCTTHTATLASPDDLAPLAIAWMIVHRLEGGRIAESWVLYRAGLDWS